jgi:hypothetical protein
MVAICCRTGSQKRWAARRARCLVPVFDGALFSLPWKRGILRNIVEEMLRQAFLRILFLLWNKGRAGGAKDCFNPREGRRGTSYLVRV